MAFLAARCNSRLLFNRLLNRSSLISHNAERTLMVKSKQFPEYSLLFDFNGVSTASKFNRAKYLSTVIYSAASPVLIVAENFTSLVSQDFLGSFLFFGGFITVFFHLSGYLFNNVIGYMYLKNDNKSVKFSCVGYWGERVDVDTTIDAIGAFSDEPSRFNNPWYQKVRLADSKTVYKMYLTAGRILDDKIFHNIFGGLHDLKKA